VPRANGRELIGLRMRLAEVHTQPALALVKLLHVSPPLKSLGPYAASSGHPLPPWYSPAAFA
jgi:hypothetical protein